MIPEIGEKFMATEIGGSTTGPWKRVKLADDKDPQPGVVYATKEGELDPVALGIKDHVFMSAPEKQASAF
jgi:hypothetical protein